jgi:hypothetical protein
MCGLGEKGINACALRSDDTEASSMRVARVGRSDRSTLRGCTWPDDGRISFHADEPSPLLNDPYPWSCNRDHLCYPNRIIGQPRLTLSRLRHLSKLLSLASSAAPTTRVVALRPAAGSARELPTPPGTAGVMPTSLKTVDVLARTRPAGHITTGQILRSYGRTHPF